MPCNHLILCRPLLLPPSIFPSIRVFSSELALILRWPKHWSFSFNNSPPNEHSDLISFRTDWFDLLAKGLSRISSSTTIQRHQLFSAQPSLWSTLTSVHDYRKKIIALTRWTFISKVMSPLFNMLSRYSSDLHFSFPFFEFWLHGVFIAVHGLRPVAVPGSGAWGSVAAVRGLSSSWHSVSVLVGHELHCSVACGTLAIRPGIEPGSLTLEGRFFFFL